MIESVLFCVFLMNLLLVSGKMLKLNSELNLVREFIYFISFLFIFILYVTGFKSIYILLTLIVYGYFLLRIKRIVIFNYRVRLFDFEFLFSNVLVLLFIIYNYNKFDLWNEFSSLSNDYGFYQVVALNMYKYGTEGMAPWYRNFGLPSQAVPYHYLDCWINSFFVGLIRLPLKQAYLIVFIPFVTWFACLSMYRFCIGYLKDNSRGIIVFLSITYVFTCGFIPFYSGDFGQSLLSQPRFYIVYILFPVFVQALNNKNIGIITLISVMLYFSNPLLGFVFLPLVVLWFVYLYIKEKSTDSLKGGILLFVSFIAYVLYYKFFGDIIGVTGTGQLTVDAIWNSFLKRTIRGSIIRLPIYYFFILGMIFWNIQNNLMNSKKWLSIEQKFILKWIAGIILTGYLWYGLFSHIEAGTISAIVQNVGLSFLFIYLVLTLIGRSTKLKKNVLLSVAVVVLLFSINKDYNGVYKGEEHCNLVGLNLTNGVYIIGEPTLLNNKFFFTPHVWPSYYGLDISNDYVMYSVTDYFKYDSLLIDPISLSMPFKVFLDRNNLENDFYANGHNVKEFIGLYNIDHIMTFKIEKEPIWISTFYKKQMVVTEGIKLYFN